MSVEAYEGLRPAAGMVPYMNAGYASTLTNLYGQAVYNTANPKVSPAIDAPSAVDSRTGLRFDQLWAAHQREVPIEQRSTGPGYKQYGTTMPERWPGARSGLGRIFAPALGALGGLAQRGFHQDQSRLANVPHLNPLWALRTLNSARMVSQRHNQTAVRVAVPGVFIPTSAGNFYKGRGL